MLIGGSFAATHRAKDPRPFPAFTVGTITEHLRLSPRHLQLHGHPALPQWRQTITRQSSEQIVQAIFNGDLCNKPDDRTLILAPTCAAAKGALSQGAGKARARWLRPRVRIDGETYPLDAPPVLDKRKNHTIEVVIATPAGQSRHRSRLEQSIATALKLSFWNCKSINKWGSPAKNPWLFGTKIEFEKICDRDWTVPANRDRGEVKFQIDTVRRVPRRMVSDPKLRFVPHAHCRLERVPIDGALGTGPASRALSAPIELAPTHMVWC